MDIEEIEEEHWNYNLGLIRKLTLENKDLKAKIAEANKLLDKLGSERELVYPASYVESPIGWEPKPFSAVSWRFLEAFEKELRMCFVTTSHGEK